jgi:hypothetical protein
MSVMVAKLQEQFLVQEREQDSRENALMARKDDMVANEHVVGRARMECDAKCDQAEAVRWDYRARMSASIVGCRCSLDFDQVLRGHQFILTVREMDLEWREEKLAEEQARGLYSFDRRDLSVELEELRKRVARVENERATEVVQLSQSIMEISDDLVDLGTFPIRDIPVQPRSA